MTSQFNFFVGTGGADQTAPYLPEGFRYRLELIDTAKDDALLAHVRQLPFREFEFHGYTGRRRVVSFGWHYISPHVISRKLMTPPNISSRFVRWPPCSLG